MKLASELNDSRIPRTGMGEAPAGAPTSAIQSKHDSSSLIGAAATPTTAHSAVMA